MKIEKVRFRLRDLFEFPGFRFSGSWDEQECIVCELKRTWKKTGICPDCGKRCRNVLDRIERNVRDFDIGRRKCYIDFVEFKISCTCGYSGMEKLSFVDKYARLTKRFEEKVALFCKVMTIKDVAEEFGLHWETVKNIDKKYMEKHLIPLSAITPKRIGVDEVAYEKGHKYLTVVRDLDLGKVIWIGEGRKKTTLDEFFRELGEEKSRGITTVVMDMWDPYIASVKEHTNADIVFDKFHIAQKATSALDKIRKKEFAKASKEERKTMKKKRFLILKRNERLTEEKREELDELMKKNTNLYSAYLLKEQLLSILDEKSVLEAIRRLGVWFRNVAKSGFKEFQSVGNTLKRYLHGILNYFRYQITNAASEGFNNKINVIKRRAFGFRDLEYFKLKILQSCGMLS